MARMRAGMTRDETATGDGQSAGCDGSGRTVRYSTWLTTTTNAQTPTCRVACKNIFGRASGNRRERLMMTGKKISHSNQKEHACSSDIVQLSGLATVAVRANKMTMPIHEHRDSHSSVSLNVPSLSVEELLNEFNITCSR